MSFEFLTAESANAVARSPMEREAAAAGARFELRDGWNVAVSYADEERALRETVGFADMSHLGKLEISGRFDQPLEPGPASPVDEALELGLASRIDGAWWCPVTRERTLVICEPGATPALRERFGSRAVEMTTSYAALTIAGPLSRELFARFCALDLRPQSAPPQAFRPGSVARTPGYVLRENGDRFLMLFGWALGRYMWETVADAAAHLGGAPVGVDALEREPVHA
jgi:glycine cleavage system aminomethyltransferase T